MASHHRKYKDRYGDTVHHTAEGQTEFETRQFSWGPRRTVGNINSQMIMHPEHHEAVSRLQPGQHHTFEDETGSRWKVHRSEDGSRFHATTRGDTRGHKGSWQNLVAHEEAGRKTATVGKGAKLKAFAEGHHEIQAPRSLQRGKKGGTFYVSKGGSKVYVSAKR